MRDLAGPLRETNSGIGKGSLLLYDTLLKPQTESCTRRSLWDGLFGQGFDSPHLHQYMPALTKESAVFNMAGLKTAPPFHDLFTLCVVSVLQ